MGLKSKTSIALADAWKTITALQDKVRRLEWAIQDQRRTHHENMSAIWEIVYPGYPDLWDYAGMVIRHVRSYIEERQMLIDDLARMLREERALRTPPLDEGRLLATARALAVSGGLKWERMHPEDQVNYVTHADELMQSHVLITRAEHNELLRHARTKEGKAKQVADMADALLVLHLEMAVESAVDAPPAEGAVA